MNNNESLFGNAFNDFIVIPPMSMHGMMKSDVYNDTDKYVIEIDMPGFTKEEVNIDYDRGYLNVIIKKQEVKDEREFIKRERFYGEYKRSYHVGKIEEEKITASFENGVLKIFVPKAESEISTKKNISIQ